MKTRIYEKKEVGSIQNSQQYGLVSSSLTIEGRTYVTYGISGPGVMCCDVSVDKRKVKGMLRKINDAQLETCHFMYFIEDELV